MAKVLTRRYHLQVIRRRLAQRGPAGPIPPRSPPRPRGGLPGRPSSADGGAIGLGEEPVPSRRIGRTPPARPAR